MTLFHSPSVQSPAAYSNQNLSGTQLSARMQGAASATVRDNLRQAFQDVSYNLRISNEETAAGLAAGNILFGSPVGDVRRYATLVLDAATDNTTALTTALGLLA